MSYKVITIRSFDRQIKRLIKKYASLKSELIGLIAELQKNLTQGTNLGNNCFKVLLAVKSKGKSENQSKRT